MNITTTVEGLERYPVNLRYSRELRHNIPALKEILVPTPAGQHIPLGLLADIRVEKGPPAIKSENSRPNAWIYVDISDSDVGGYVERPSGRWQRGSRFRPGTTSPGVGSTSTCSAPRSGFDGRSDDARHHLHHYLSEHEVFLETAIVLLAVPFSLVGVFWLMWWLDYNLSIAVWVGIIALAV